MKPDFLGAGFAFPFSVTPRGKLAFVRAEQRIEEAIYLILGTKLGERVMKSEFGCGVHDIVFAPNDPTTRADAVDAVREALVSWEARIDVLDVAADFDPSEPSLLLIRIDYRIRSNNAVANLVYPFYINESFV